MTFKDKKDAYEELMKVRLSVMRCADREIWVG